MSFSSARWLHYLTFLIPPLYLAAILWLQPADHLGDPQTDWPIGRLLYDDYDLTAFALRGLNAAQGRTPGGPHPEQLNPQAFDASLDFPLELAPRYFLEYPPATLLLFRLGWLGQPAASAPEVPSAVLDGWHNSIVQHGPRDQAEQDLWRQFRRAIQVYLVLMTLCLLGLMVVLQLGYEPAGNLSGPIFLLILPSALYFSLNRFDVVPALLVGLSLFCIGRGRFGTSAFLLGTATMLKVYPVLLAPLFFRYLWHDRRAALRWSAVYAATLLAFALPPVLAWGPEVAWAPLQFQLQRPLEPHWTFFGLVLPESMGQPSSSWLRLGCVLATASLLCLDRPDDLAGLLRRAALLLLVFVALQVFFSPQWLLWLAPLLIPLARRDRILLLLLIALDLLTYWSFPWVYDSTDLASREAMRPWLVRARFVLLAALAGVLAVREYSNTFSRDRRKRWED